MLTVDDLPSFDLDGERFVRPDFAGRGLANIAPTVLRLLAPLAAPVDLPPLDQRVLPESMTSGIGKVVVIGCVAIAGLVFADRRVPSGG